MIKKAIIFMCIFVLAMSTVNGLPLSIRQDVISDDTYDESLMYGKVVNKAGTGLYGASVTAINTKTGRTFVTTTDPLGKFGLDITKGCTYDIRFEYNGNVKEYEGKTITRRTYFPVTLKVSYKLTGNYEWKWRYFNHSKVAVTDFKFSRLYLDNNQMYRLLYTYDSINSGLTYSSTHGKIGSKTNEVVEKDNIITFDMDNVNMTVFDIPNGYSYMDFKTDSIVNLKIPERDKITAVDDSNRWITYMDSERQNSLVLAGYGEMLSDEQEVNIFANANSVLFFMSNTNVYMDSYINDILNNNIDVIIEVYTTDNGEIKAKPIILSDDCTVSQVSFSNETFDMDISTTSNKKISAVVSYDSSEYLLSSITANNQALKTVSSSSEVIALAIVPKTYLFRNNGHTYQYIVMPDNQDANIKGEYSSLAEF
jgi:hypothetical protein